MDPLTVAAASGLRSRLESLSLLANNLANATTSGYKTDRESYGLYVSEQAESPLGVATLPVIERGWTDFSQGTVQSTGNPLDVALSGKGLLAVDGPGGVLYSRNGSLQISSSGELVNGDGYKLRAVGGGNIQLTSNRPVEIASDGSVVQDGRTIGRMAVVDFKTNASLRKVSGSCFENTDPTNAVFEATDVEMMQGKLETSNVAVPEAAMRLVGVMRQFEMLQKAVSMGVEMNAKAIQEVARVNS